MVFGYGISTLSRPLLALAGGWGQVLGSRFVDRFGKGVRTAPRDAIVADSVEARELGRSFGFHRAMDQFGAVLGPAIAFLILYRASQRLPDRVLDVLDPRRVCRFLSSSCSSRRSGRSRPERPSKRPRGRLRAVSGATAPSGRSRGGSRGATGRDLQRRDALGTRLARLRGPLLAYLVVTAIFSLGNSSDAFLILRARDLQVAAALIPVLYVVFNFIYSRFLDPGRAACRSGRTAQGGADRLRGLCGGLRVDGTGPLSGGRCGESSHSTGSTWASPTETDVPCWPSSPRATGAGPPLGPTT